MYIFNPLNAELNPICHLLALLVAHLILHVSRIKVNEIHRNATYITMQCRIFVGWGVQSI